MGEEVVVISAPGEQFAARARSQGVSVIEGHYREEHVLRAALAQFEADDVVVERRPETQTIEDVHRVVDEAQHSGAMLVHTLASVDLRREMYLQATERRVQSVDLLGNVLSDLSAFLGAAPGGVPGGVHRLDENYYRRMDALTFVVKHDDGLGVEDLHRADIVLVGVSRTSKTPLSMYLGYLCRKTANVPIVKGIDPPAELFEVDPAKVVGLTIDASRLAEIRQARVRNLGTSPKAYAELLEIYDELEHAAAIHRRLGCPVIEVSELSIEETAQRVIRIVEQRLAEAQAS